MATAPSILVIDDEQGILETLRILLKNEGFDVTTAQGGKAGLEQLKNSAPDIVLTDLKMPGVTGIEILSAVRGQDPETPVILMTAQASLQTAIQAVNEGAFYYIQKPFSNDDMVAICRTGCAGCQWPSSDFGREGSVADGMWSNSTHGSTST